MEGIRAVEQYMSTDLLVCGRLVKCVYIFWALLSFIIF
jgi:hypothetical protein